MNHRHLKWTTNLDIYCKKQYIFTSASKGRIVQERREYILRSSGKALRVRNPSLYPQVERLHLVTANTLLSTLSLSFAELQRVHACLAILDVLYNILELVYRRWLAHHACLGLDLHLVSRTHALEKFTEPRTLG